MKFTILIDLDDTIEDLLGSWVPELNRLYGTTVDINDITDWDISKFFPTLTRYQVFSPLFDDDFWDLVKPQKDAVRYLKALKDDGHAVYICTTSNYKTLKSKIEKVLFRYFDFLTWNDVIITSNKQLINADILIDDGIHNLIDGRYLGILMDAPHNRSFNEKDYNIIRVKSWEDIYRTINLLARE